MKKIIGGLLVISLLSRPSMLRVDYIAYEIYKVSDQIIRGIRGIQAASETPDGDADDETDAADIDAALAGIDRNARGITRLLHDLDGTMSAMSGVMRRKSAARAAFTEEQMAAFTGFNTLYAEKTSQLDASLATISRYIGRSSHEILSDDTNLTQLHKKLMDVTDRQYDAIAGLNGIISAARDTLQTIA